MSNDGPRHYRSPHILHNPARWFEDEECRAFAGDGIFRLSVGIEEPDDLCNDLEQALAHTA